MAFEAPDPRLILSALAERTTGIPRPGSTPLSPRDKVKSPQLKPLTFRIRRGLPPASPSRTPEILPIIPRTPRLSSRATCPRLVALHPNDLHFLSQLSFLLEPFDLDGHLLKPKQMESPRQRSSAVHIVASPAA